MKNWRVFDHCPIVLENSMLIGALNHLGYLIVGYKMENSNPLCRNLGED